LYQTQSSLSARPLEVDARAPRVLKARAHNFSIKETFLPARGSDVRCHNGGSGGETIGQAAASIQGRGDVEGISSTQILDLKRERE
jgi:hypothetical protein